MTLLQAVAQLAQLQAGAAPWVAAKRISWSAQGGSCVCILQVRFRLGKLTCLPGLPADMARHTDGLEDFAASLRLWGPDLGAWTPDKRTAALQVRQGLALAGAWQLLAGAGTLLDRLGGC